MANFLRDMSPHAYQTMECLKARIEKLEKINAKKYHEKQVSYHKRQLWTLSSQQDNPARTKRII